MIRDLRALIEDRRGATIIEFAIVAPVMVLLIMGMGDLLYQEYAQSILTGAVQKAGRDSAIQGGGDAAATIDGKVIASVASIMRAPTQTCPAVASGTWCAVRKNYDSFSQIAPEPFTDTDNDGRCDHGEAFYDQNGNGRWDVDPGASGQGGANDVTVYTVSITYPQLFPVAGLLGWSATQTISATTLLKNQPYASQAVTAVAQGNCP